MLCFRFLSMVCVFKHLYCSAQLSMSNMEKRYRNKIIIIMLLGRAANKQQQIRLWGFKDSLVGAVAWQNTHWLSDIYPQAVRHCQQFSGVFFQSHWCVSSLLMFVFLEPEEPFAVLRLLCSLARALSGAEMFAPVSIKPSGRSES